jgi:nucleoside-diphosphate-sugar epimerase
MKIAIIGGAGLLGHNAAVELTRRGHEVMIIDAMLVNNRFSISPDQRFYRDVLDQRQKLLNEADVPVIAIDARDYGMLSTVLVPTKPDLLIHMAGVSNIVSSNKDPFSTYGHNLTTLENTLDIARSIDARVIYFSSSTVYGNFSSPILGEEAPCNPFGIYGALKYAGELLVNAHRNVYEMDTTIIRPCALYGPRCISRRVGQIFIENAITGKPITIFGDGEIYEDFTFTEDFIQGLRLVVESDTTGETFNITSGHAHSLNELAQIVANRYGAEIIHGPADPEKPHRGTLDISKARDLLGYAPSHTLETGMKKYMDWYDECVRNNRGPDA